MSLLFIPLIGMQFSEEVQWSLFDFITMGVLLFCLGIGIHFIVKKTAQFKKRFLFISLTIALFLLLWAEFAVGVFGSPLAGN